MHPADRRSFLTLLGSGAFAAAMQQSIGRALAIPANQHTGTIQDVEHVVMLMQENHSFDHHDGTLQGVRGFGDPRAVRLPSGNPVWFRPVGTSYVLPFHPTAPDLGLQFIEDQWVPQKGATTMAHLDRGDIAFHYARWPTPSPSATRTTPRCSGRPTQPLSHVDRLGRR